MELLPYVFVASVALISGILSGISGGGGGMLMIPAYILIGLSPQQAVATGKMNGLGSAYGGLLAFAKTGHIRKDILKVMIPIAIVVGVSTPFIFTSIDSKVFQIILGVLLIILTPTLFLKKRALHIPTKKHRTIGYICYSAILSLQAVFSSGVGNLAMYVLTLLLGTTKLEANATKRAVTASLVPITFVALLIAGFVELRYGIVGLILAFIGTHVGSKIAIQKGEDFITIFMAATIAVAGVALVINAL